MNMSEKELDLTEKTKETNRNRAPSKDCVIIFNAVLRVAKKNLSPFVWQGFFEPLSPVDFRENCLIINSPSNFHKNWIKDHYLQELKKAASGFLGKSINVLVIHNQIAKEELLLDKKTTKSLKIKTESALIEKLNPHAAHRDQASKDHNLDPSYTFDNFISGPSNQMGFAACNAVAENPGEQFSPLFLFGSAGLGKTHLLHAIGLAVKEKKKSAVVNYMSAEQWVNAYIRAIRNKDFEAFRRKFRSSCDLLLIDDIQFLAGKNASQDEFFHTFNSLHQAKRQIVVTSDKCPHEIDGLEERLKTRLSWGLIVDIRPPEIETRIAILYKKAENKGIDLPENVANYIATQITSSVRELEGALNRLLVFASVSKTKIGLDEAREHLSPILRGKTCRLTVEKICQCIANYYGLNASDLRGKSRERKVTLPRQIVMSFCRSHLSLSLSEIGKLLGGRGHSAVLSALKKIDSLLRCDEELKKSIETIEKILKKE